MMLRAWSLAAFLAAPFWEAKPPQSWTEDELTALLSKSPWAQMAEAQAGPLVQVYLATAKPMRDAEAEVARRRAIADDQWRREYREFLEDNIGKSIVLAVRMDNPLAMADGAEARRMEQESFMKVGRKKHKMTGHFLPTPSDPYLRMVFPRVVQETDKDVAFDLYVPGVTNPYRLVNFRVKGMLIQGKLEI